MSADGEARQLTGEAEADEPGWEVDPDDEWGVAVITTVGRQLRLRREAAGMRAADFAVAVGYGEDLVYKVEGGKRIPRQEYKADEVLGAGGLVAAAWEDVKKVRYPKKVRELAKLEAQAVEVGVYESNGINGGGQVHPVGEGRQIGAGGDALPGGGCGPRARAGARKRAVSGPLALEEGRFAGDRPPQPSSPPKRSL